jgi:cobalt-zinc-cadmium resistance protein CzcA
MQKLFILFVYIFFFAPFFRAEKYLFAQTVLSRKAAVDSAYKNNPAILAGKSGIERQRAYMRSAFLLDRTELWLEAPQADRFTIGVQQMFSFPSVYVNEFRLQKGYVKLAEVDLSINRNRIGRQTESLYLELQMLNKKLELFRQMDSLYSALYRSTEKRYSIGDAAYLEKLLEETKSLEVKNRLFQVFQELESAETQLLKITGIAADTILTDKIDKYESLSIFIDTIDANSNPVVQYFNLNKEISARNLKLQKSFIYPGFFAGYLNQGAAESSLLYRFRFGVTFPLWFPAYAARIRSARIGINVADLQYRSALNNFSIQKSKIEGELKKSALQLQFYENSGLKQAEELIRTASRLFSIGEISYFNYLQSLAQAVEIKINYLNALKNFNQAVIDRKYLSGE